MDNTDDPEAKTGEEDEQRDGSIRDQDKATKDSNGETSETPEFSQLVTALARVLKVDNKGALKGEDDFVSTLKPPKLKPLKALDKESLSEFLVRYNRTSKRMRAAGKTIDLVEWLSGVVYEKIEAHGVNMDDEAAILQHLNEYKDLLDGARDDHALSHLRGKLSWPTDANNCEEALQRFLFQAQELVGWNKVSNDKVQKQMIPILVVRLPP